MTDVMSRYSSVYRPVTPHLTMWTNFFKNFSAPRLTCGFSVCGHLIGQVSGTVARARVPSFLAERSRLDKWLTRRAMFSMQHRFTRSAARRGTAPPRPGRPAGLTFENSTVATESGAIPQSMRPAILPERQLRLPGHSDPVPVPIWSAPIAPRLVSVLVSNGQVSDRKRINATVKDAIPKSLTASTGNCDSINCDREPWGESKELGMCACCLRIENVSRIHYGGANGSP